MMSILIVSCNEKSNVINPNEAINQLKSINVRSFENWNISLRADDMGIFDYNDGKNAFGFLCKVNKGEYFIKDKSWGLDAKFVKFSNFRAEKIENAGFSKNKLLSLIKGFFNSKTFNINYLNSFDGILFEEENCKVFFLLSDSNTIELPPSYKKIKNNWFILDDNVSN